MGRGKSDSSSFNICAKAYVSHILSGLGDMVSEYSSCTSEYIYIYMKYIVQGLNREVAAPRHFSVPHKGSSRTH